MSALEGKRVLVTRPRAQAADLCALLEAHGAQPIVLPAIEIVPGEDAGLDTAIAALDAYAWVIFTSVNGVSAFFERLQRAGRDASAFAPVRVAAIGPATAQALEMRGVAVQFIPDEYVAERILDGLGEVRGLRILLPRADIARKALADELAARGALVDEIAAYRTVAAAPDAAGLAELRRGVDVITFTSSSTVRSFAAQIGRELGDALVACIGPITARTAREEGLRVDLVAETYTMEGLVKAVERHFAEQGEGR